MTTTREGPRRLWRVPPRRLTRPWAVQAFQGTDEYCNPTIALGLPGLGLWVLAYPWRLYTTLCNEADCENPTCEVAAFYRTKEA